MTSLARLAAGLSAGLIFSRLLGLARDMLTAWLLGAGPFGDALAVAVRLPNVMRRLLGEGALSMSMTADLIRESKKVPDKIFYATSSAYGHIFFPAIVFFLVLLGEACAPALIDFLAPGLNMDVAAQAAFLLRICLPYVFLASLAAMDMAAMHAAGRFAAPALSPALFNVIFILSVIGALLLHPGAGQEYMATALATGMLFGGAAQVLLQRMALRGLPAPSSSPLPAEKARAVMPGCKRAARILAGIFGAAGLQLAMLCAMFQASWLPGGSVAALNYAERLVELPIAITGAAIGMAGLPIMAELAVGGRHEEFAKNIGVSLRLALFVALPAMAGLMAVSGDLVRALLGHGAFNEKAAVLTATALCAYAPGLPAYALARPLLAACNAQNDISTPALSGLLLIFCSIVSGFALLAILPENMALVGPALGVSLGLWAQVFPLWLAVRARLAQHGQRLSLPGMWIPATGSLAAAGAALATGRLISGPFAGLTLSVGAGVLAYGAVTMLCGAEELKYLRDRRKK